MTEPALSQDFPDEPDVSHLVTEDDTPVDNWFQDKQMRLLAEVLDVSWPEGRPFVSGTDVGLFSAVKPAIVPDFLLSLGVEYPEDYHEKNRRSYFTWVFGKSPDLVLEIVSNREGGEDTDKLITYAGIHVPYYVIYDPFRHLSQRPLRIYQLTGATYVEKIDRLIPEVGLAFTLWEGEFDGLTGVWVRWSRPNGELLATGAEAALRATEQTHRAEAQQQRADEQQQRADEQQHRADEQQQRADAEESRRLRLEAELRRLGVDPNQLGPETN